jgi:hypothetical protein
MTMTDHRQADRVARQLRKYGITEEQYEAQLQAQGNRCPLCTKVFSSTRLPAIEHRHTDGLWRGITCIPCNFEMGAHHDKADWFRRVADYLDNPPAETWHHYIPGSLGASREP